MSEIQAESQGTLCNATSENQTLLSDAIINIKNKFYPFCNNDNFMAVIVKAIRKKKACPERQYLILIATFVSEEQSTFGVHKPFLSSETETEDCRLSAAWGQVTGLN